ncbi:MAG: putative Ig domain-containing protein, partial [Myxococcales bacterium]|nr:putative Ig domain-containing protein [Myxococcales bacterium]
WSPQGTYRVTGDATINASYDFSAKDAFDSWQTRGNTWSQSGDILSLTTALGIANLTRAARVWPGGVGLTDFHFAIRVRFSRLLGTNWGGILFRFRDLNNYYFAGLYGDRLSLSVVVNGNAREIGTFAVSRQDSTWYTIRVRVQGTQIQVDLNGQQRISVTDSSHGNGTIGVGAEVTSLLTLFRSVDFTGPAKDFELREAGGMVKYRSNDILSQWTKYGAGNWTAPDQYRLYQSLNTEFDTGYFNPNHTSLKDYTYVQEMWVSSSTDDDVIGLTLRYKQTQATPHRFTGYVFEWSRGGALQPYRRLVRVVNGGYGAHTGTWQRINHTVLKQDNTTWLPNTLYVMRAKVKGNRIQIWINEQLWADVTDTDASAPTEGAFGPFNWSNPDFNVRHMTLYYDPATLPEVVSTPKATVAVNPAWTRIGTTTVGNLLSGIFTGWLQGQQIPPANASITRYQVLFDESTTFEGMPSVNGTTAAPSDANAFPYARQKAGTLRYHVYRGGQRLTNTPLTAQTYLDKYTCSVAPGTTFAYQVTQLNPANQESALSTPPASVTTRNDPPTISGVPDQTGVHGTAWTLDLTTYAKDINLNTLTITTDSSYVTVTGTTLRFFYPTGDKITSEEVTITVTDCHGAKASQKIKVTLQNRPPVFTSQPPTSATTGALYSYNASATDPDDGDVLKFSLQQAPAGATVDATTGAVTWTPAAGDAGKSITFVLEVCDDRSPPSCTQQTWQVLVSTNNSPPVITSTAPTAATEDQPFTYAPTATDPDGDPITWRFAKAPTGATIDPTTGKVSWTPGDADAETDAEFEIQACDSKGACASQAWKAKVANTPDAPKFTSTPPTTAIEDQRYSYTPTATDPDPGTTTLTYKKIKGPTGATVDPNTGEVVWTPGDADAGKTIDFEIEVCDQDGNCAKQAWQVTVTNTPDAPKITSTPPTTADEKQEYNYKPTVVDPDPGQTSFTFRTTQAPAGATIDPNTGEIKWTPGAAEAGKEYDFEIEVCDVDGNCTRQAWKVKVNNVNDPPVVTSTPPTEAFVARELNYKPTVSDPDPADTHTWKLLKGPAGATIDPNTGELKWTPTAADAGKDVEFEIEVCDNGTPPACVKQSFTTKVKVPCGVDKDCPQSEICVDGVCVPPGCASMTPKCSSQGDFCNKAQCNPDPCAGVTCAAGEFCRPSDGQCVKPCSGVQCQQGERCVDGVCVAEPCTKAGTPCAQDEYCDNSDSLNPKCIKDPCKTATDSCRYDRSCLEGRCLDDPCSHLP